MARTTALLTAIVVLAGATAIVAAKKAPVDRFTGTYDWSDGGSDSLAASFTPDGAGGWEVEFSFRFGGKNNKWKGRAAGSLEEGGQLKGTSGWSGRKWEFEAEVKGGVLVGTHAEIRRSGERYTTGSFELRR